MNLKKMVGKKFKIRTKKTAKKEIKVVINPSMNWLKKRYGVIPPKEDLGKKVLKKNNI